VSIITRLLNIYKSYYLSSLKKHGVQIGKNLFLGQGVYIDGTYGYLIKIGDNVAMGRYCCVLAHDSSSTLAMGSSKFGKVEIGNNVVIGANSIILPGVSIGDDVIIGGGSIVTKDIPGRTVYGGNPAKMICTLDEYIEKRKQAMQKFPVITDNFKNNPEVLKKMSGKIAFNSKSDQIL
jgi:maltose O-acetyltransferase